MKKGDFEKLAASIKEAREIKAGQKEPSRVYEVKPPEIKRVRKRLKLYLKLYTRNSLANKYMEQTARGCLDCSTAPQLM